MYIIGYVGCVGLQMMVIYPARAWEGYSSHPVCLSVGLSRSDFGDYWQLTVDLGMVLTMTIKFKTFYYAFFFIIRPDSWENAKLQLCVGTSFCGNAP